MPNARAREILLNENKMLEILIAAINAFAKDYENDDFQFQNLSCWAKELNGYRVVNEKYRGMSDNDLKAELQKEADILKNCLAQISETGDAAEYWKTNLRENIWYTEQTRDRV